MTSLYHFMTSLCMVSSKHESTRVNESLKKLITFLIMNSTFSVNQKYERMWYVRILWPFIYKLRPFWEKLVETYGHSTWRTTLSNCTKQCESPITYHDITLAITWSPFTLLNVDFYISFFSCTISHFPKRKLFSSSSSVSVSSCLYLWIRHIE